MHKTVKAFDKESGLETEEPRKLKKSVRKHLAVLELTEACRFWLESQAAAPLAPVDEQVEEAPAPTTAKATEAKVAAAEVAEAPAATEKRGKKRDAEAAADAAPEATPDADVETPPAKKRKGERDKEQKAGVPFKRVDEEKWTAAIKDHRMLDNTHKAKQKFGGSAGDSWGDKAAEDMLKVKGKGFRKEMAKKKRASWRGAGAIDQGVNSVKFDDSSDEE